MTALAIPNFGPLLTVLDAANACLGFLLRRRHEFEAVDSDGATIGLFETVSGAIAAVYEVRS